MIEIPIYNQAGEEVEKFQLDEAKLGGEIRQPLLKQAIVMYHANKRQGTVKSKGRGEVAGSTRKMFRQKGTGNARTGGIRNPIKVGGGHAKQKSPKDWRLAMPKKMRNLARGSAVLSKIQSNDIKIISDLKLEESKTKHVTKLLKALGIERSFLLALAGHDQGIERSARNIAGAYLTTVAQLNAFEILQRKTLLMTKAGLEQLLALE